MRRSFLSRSFCSRALPAFWPDELQWQALQQQTSESLRALADVRSDNATLRRKAFKGLLGTAQAVRGPVPIYVQILYTYNTYILYI